MSWALCLILLACDRRVPPAPAAAGPLPAAAQAADPGRIPDVSAWRPLGPPQPSHAGPHRGATQRIYLNAIAAKALAEGRFQPWPDGAQLVKESFDERGARMAWSWMSREQGQWVWAQADADAKVDERVGGSENACAACHLEKAEATGGAFTPGLAKAPGR